MAEGDECRWLEASDSSLVLCQASLAVLVHRHSVSRDLGIWEYRGWSSDVALDTREESVLTAISAI